MARDQSNGWDNQARSSALLRAHSYLFLGQWPYPTTDKAFEVSSVARAVFFEAMGLADWKTLYLNATYQYEGNPIQLAVVVALPSSSVTVTNGTRLPLLLVSTGLDYFKEVRTQ